MWRQIDPNSISGDTPADIMGAAIDQIIAEYQHMFHRKPTRAELQYAFDFVVETCLEEAGADDAVSHSE